MGSNWEDLEKTAKAQDTLKKAINEGLNESKGDIS